MKPLLCLCLVLLTPSTVLAVWASYLIVTPDGIEGKGIKRSDIPIPTFSTNANGDVSVRLVDPRQSKQGPHGKFYQLVRTSEPLADSANLK